MGLLSATSVCAVALLSLASAWKTPTVLGSWLYVVGAGDQFNGPVPPHWSINHNATGQFVFTSTHSGTWVWPVVSPTDAGECVRSTILNQAPFTIVVNMASCSSPNVPADLPFTLVAVGF